MILEEDFILPQSTKFILPFWRHQISQRLDKFDVVGFQTTMDNQCFDFFPGNDKESTPWSFYHSWIYEWINAQVIGSGLATTAKFYASLANKPPFYTGTDGECYTKAPKVCISSLRGYHIGWNQEMDGYKKIADFNRFPSSVNQIQKVINLVNGEESIWDLSQLHTKFNGNF